MVERITTQNMGVICHTIEQSVHARSYFHTLELAISRFQPTGSYYHAHKSLYIISVFIIFFFKLNALRVQMKDMIVMSIRCGDLGLFKLKHLDDLCAAK